MISLDVIINFFTQSLTFTIWGIWAVATIIITTIASIQHEKYAPAVWGWLVAFIFVYFADNIRPVVLGWIGFADSNIYLFIVSFGLFFNFVLLWVILIANTINKGDVVL